MKLNKAVLALALSGALFAGCCVSTGKVYSDGRITSFDISNDKSADAPMTVYTQDNVYELAEVLEGVDGGRPAEIHNGSDDCSSNTLFCLAGTEDETEDCAEIVSMKERSGDSGGSKDTDGGLGVEVQ